jgi:hypothetical protein
MRQLLTYGIKLGQQKQNADMDPDELLKEAEVRFLFSPSLMPCLTLFRKQRLVAELKALES